MNGTEYEDERYWEKVYASRERYLQENVTTYGNDGEDEFDDKILQATVGKVVLDVGCGIGAFAIRVAERAKRIIGLDVSRGALKRAKEGLSKSEVKNVTFKLGSANAIPFPSETFDLVLSRRGPVTESMATLKEAYRVLKKGGLLMEITIGEKDKQSIAQIFGRGQMYGVKEKVIVAKERMLRDVGFEVVEIKEYMATEAFRSIQDLIIRLKSVPIIPNFDVLKDKEYLELVETNCKTPRGIEAETHRVTITARK